MRAVCSGTGEQFRPWLLGGNGVGVVAELVIISRLPVAVAQAMLSEFLINAAIHYMLEAPGSKAIKSGFVSLSNPSATAKNLQDRHDVEVPVILSWTSASGNVWLDTPVLSRRKRLAIAAGNAHDDAPLAILI